MSENTPVIYACSPRTGGNTDCAAHCLKQGAALAGKEASLLFLRDHPTAPCCSCYACATPPHACALDQNSAPADGMSVLTAPLLTAPILFFAAPVFFYHLPAQFKAFMDRTQRFYLMKQCGDPQIRTLSQRTAYAVLLGARKSGAKLFEGSLLSLRLMLGIFNIVLAKPLLLYGLDGSTDLSSNSALQTHIVHYGRQAFSHMQIRHQP